MRDWIVSQALDSVIMRVLQNAFQFVGPNDNAFVCTTWSKPFAIPSIGNAIDSVFVTFQRLYERSCKYRFVSKTMIWSTNIKAYHLRCRRQVLVVPQLRQVEIHPDESIGHKCTKWKEDKVIWTTPGLMERLTCSFRSRSWTLSTQVGTARIFDFKQQPWFRPYLYTAYTSHMGTFSKFFFHFQNLPVNSEN